MEFKIICFLNEAPLHWAVCNQSIEIIKLFATNSKVNINVQNKSFYIPY